MGTPGLAAILYELASRPKTLSGDLPDDADDAKGERDCSGDYSFTLSSQGSYTLSFGMVTGYTEYTYDTPVDTSPGQDNFTFTEGQTVTVSAGLSAPATSRDRCGRIRTTRR
jgi:hypothetical protein